MDYEKKYNEALKWMRELYPGLHGATKEDAEHYFPELRESEDERIRKVIYKLMLGMREEIFTSQDEIVTKEKALAYLEKKPGIKIWPHEIIDAMNGEHDPANIYSEDGRLIAKKDESEDERIWKWLVDYFSSIKKTVWVHRDITCEQILEWLEKQKEQKPAEKQDYSGLNDLERAILRGFLCAGVENVPVGIIKDTASECMGFLALIEPNPAEWSEEDKTHLNWIIECLGSWKYQVPEFADQYQSAIDFLKSLRPSWKPSEEQMGGKLQKEE